MGLIPKKAYQRRMLWLDFLAVLRWPLTYWERRVEAKRRHELAMATVAAESNARVLEAMGKLMVDSNAQILEVARSSNQTIQTWLEGFKVTELPSSTTVTEADEAAWEADEEEEARRERGRAERFSPTPEELNARFGVGATKLAPPIGPDFLPFN